jgi:transposase
MIGLPSLAALDDAAGPRIWMASWKEQLLPRHPMAEAIQYALSQWNELNVFARDGAVPIDNNVSEREMKRIVLTRKNSLFAGNPRGGRTAAILASLTSTCRRHEIDPQRYLTQLLVNLPSFPIRQLSDWLPDQWKQHQSAPSPALRNYGSRSAHARQDAVHRALTKADAGFGPR